MQEASICCWRVLIFPPIFLVQFVALSLLRFLEAHSGQQTSISLSKKDKNTATWIISLHFCQDLDQWKALNVKWHICVCNLCVHEDVTVLLATGEWRALTSLNFCSCLLTWAQISRTLTRNARERDYRDYTVLIIGCVWFMNIDRWTSVSTWRLGNGPSLGCEAKWTSASCEHWTESLRCKPGLDADFTQDTDIKLNI